MRLAVRNSAVRSAPSRSISIGTNANTIVLISIGVQRVDRADRHRQFIRLGMRAQEIGRHCYAHKPEHIADYDSRADRHAAANQRIQP